ncbi:MAG: T9SS type A sorting domain-containing protein [candidate division WOR-3 bacterium]
MLRFFSFLPSFTLITGFFLSSLFGEVATFTEGKEITTIQELNFSGKNIGILGRYKTSEKAFPGYDTLYWHDYSPYNGGYTGVGYLFGFGVKLEPEYYPAIITGVHHRVFRLRSDSMQIRIVDDDGSGGAPGLTLRKYDTLTTTYSTSFIYHALPPPKCTIWDGKFYLFLLDAHHPAHSTDYGLNWLRDNDGVQAPTGYHWKHDSLGNYTQWNPYYGDMEMGVVVEYHDVSLDSLTGLKENDTVFIDSTYRIKAFCRELAGFAEPNLPVIFKVANLYVDTEYISLNPNQSDTVRFDWLVNLPEGIYDGICYTNLSSDTRKANDTFHFSITVVGRHDVGCTKIIAPTGIVDSGAVITPACSVYNYGNLTESYSVRLKIGSSYDTTVSVSDHNPRTYLYLTFPDWTALELGNFIVSCSTELSRDENLENDRALDSVSVRRVSGVGELIRNSEGYPLSFIPNPIRGLLKVSYHLPKKNLATLKIYNPLGYLVRTEKSDKGFFMIKNLPAGVYLLRLSGGDWKEERKIIILP